jgi:hypothetical protein
MKFPQTFSYELGRTFVLILFCKDTTPRATRPESSARQEASSRYFISRKLDRSQNVRPNNSTPASKEKANWKTGGDCKAPLSGVSHISCAHIRVECGIVDRWNESHAMLPKNQHEPGLRTLPIRDAKSENP